MKTTKLFTAALIATVLFTSCSSDDDTPEIVNEEEVITTLTVTLTATGTGDIITLQTQDLDGDGPDDPVVTVSGNLAAGETYNGSIVLLNETVSPAEDITEEVEDESDEHQFFYTASSSLDVTTAYANYDEDGNPLGTEFTLTAGEASSGSLTFTLIHEPVKPNTGLTDAGGETDAEATFSVTVE
ncbi:type 1 periplasmic binding fold superfamily protein [Formosa sediminum]|uniref:Type 1 periplasmic binding fold superfamily protein n=1 Tax=Formosa sediminum TaxID=2594004 RepID=A0A516GW07_9FLAO|nr:type 1 periplasmic binding fold superfamily protein [Formosa sediminum]QDO95713.1 type 1 periplasmic binding fold superfamily protein [Formosa sediminum]